MCCDFLSSPSYSFSTSPHFHAHSPLLPRIPIYTPPVTCRPYHNRTLSASFGSTSPDALPISPPPPSHHRRPTMPSSLPNRRCAIYSTPSKHIPALPHQTSSHLTLLLAHTPRPLICATECELEPCPWLALARSAPSHQASPTLVRLCLISSLDLSKISVTSQPRAPHMRKGDFARTIFDRFYGPMGLLSVCCACEVFRCEFSTCRIATER